MLRGLIHYWRASLAVALGAAVATTVLSGALVVGDSLRGSLRDQTQERLGAVDLALEASRPFPESLVERLAATSAGGDSRLGGGLAVRASARHAELGSVASQVALVGVRPDFLALFPEGDQVALDRPEGSFFTPVTLNRSLADELTAEVGDEVVLTFERPDDVPRESLLGRRDDTHRLASLRGTVTGILDDRGLGGFRLDPSQTVRLNAFVPARDLARAAARIGELDLLVADLPDGQAAGVAEQELAEALEGVLGPEDVGLQVRIGAGWVQVESSSLVLAAPVAAAARAAAEALGAPAEPALVHLANRIVSETGFVPYSTVLATDWADAGSGLLELAAGDARLGAGAGGEGSAEDAVILDAWTAEALEVSPGDRVRMEYFVTGPDDGLTVDSTTLRVAGVAAMTGAAVDPTWVPNLPGVSDAEDMGSWDPPFPVDLSWVGERDEEYWDHYRGAPKVFLPLGLGQSLWGSRFGDLTTLRVRVPEGEEPAAFARRLEEEVIHRLPRAAQGLELRPVRREALEAASGNTDFAGLFLGFSMFLIAAAALLVALLFSLAVEGRAREIGLLLAVGYPLPAVRRRFLGEGAILALFGVALGALGSRWYASAVLAGVESWWGRLLPGAFLEVHWRPLSLAAGLVSALLLILVTLATTLRRLLALPPRRLLAADTAVEAEPGRGGPWPRRLLAGAGAVTVVLAGSAVVVGGSDPALFFSLGAAACTAGLAAFAVWCGRGGGGLGVGVGPLGRWRMAVRSARRSPGRSVLAVALVGAASFVLVAVAANRGHGVDLTAGRSSGTGGYTILAESDVSIHGDPLAPGRLAGTEPRDRQALEGLELTPLRLRSGDDASCLNLYQPAEPRIVGVTPAFVERGGFAFAETLEPAEEPWRLLQAAAEPGVVPAIGDANSVRWILHLGLGDELTLVDDHGEEVRLRIVGLLAGSLFQSELLISESAFLRHFPSQGGFRLLLGDSAPGAVGTTARALEVALSRYGVDATGTAERIEAYQAVEGMYLATFQALGGLGLLLGTLGLGVILARNVAERRGELATMRAFGFRRSTLGWLVVGENAFLSSAGLAVGAGAGLLAVAPRLAAHPETVPWLSLAATLTAVFAAGLLASVVAVTVALRTPMLGVLKEE